MLIKVIKFDGDTAKPDMVDMDTVLKVGDIIKLEYDWHTKQPRKHYKDVAEFKVVDIVCNMVRKPNAVWVRLSSDDKTFLKRCGSREFDVPEKQVLERLVA